ncbi:DsbA family protein [Paenibacillus marinisediminis]
MQKKYIFGIGITVVLILIVAVVYGVISSGNDKADQEAINDQYSMDQFRLNEQPVKGDRSAPIQIVEVGDYKCPSCKKWTETVYPLIDEAYVKTGKAAFYYVGDAFLGPDSEVAAMAAKYMYDQAGEDAFWRFHDLLLQKQGDKDAEWANINFLSQLVEEHFPEVDVKDFTSALEERRYEQQVLKDIESIQHYDIKVVPTVFINGRKVEGARYEDVQAIIEDELHRSEGAQKP